MEKSEAHQSDDRRAALAALVRKAAGGSRADMEELLVRAQEVAYRFSLLVCGHPEDAEDVMQDALLNTYRHVSELSEPDAFRTWLYTTVRNACRMKRRRRAGEPSKFVAIDERPAEGGSGDLPVDVADSSRPADQRVMDRWIDQRLRRALLTLPPGHRMIVVLREIEGLSTKEVAAITRISEANVKARLHRARIMLRRQLEDL